MKYDCIFEPSNNCINNYCNPWNNPLFEQAQKKLDKNKN